MLGFKFVALKVLSGPEYKHSLSLNSKYLTVILFLAGNLSHSQCISLELLRTYKMKTHAHQREFRGFWKEKIKQKSLGIFDLNIETKDRERVREIERERE